MAAAVDTTLTRTIIAMAIPNEVGGVRIAAAHFLARTSICLLALGAVAWGASVLPLFWQQATLDRVAGELLQGRAFKMQTFLDQARQVETAEQSSFCNPTALHDAVVLRLAIFSKAIAATTQPLIDSTYTQLHDATTTALSCAPADSFAWLTLFWLSVRKNGFSLENAKYLRLSHALGPNEGWIALWRVRLTLSLFSQLPGDLSDQAIGDFIKLVDAFIPETAAIFANAAPAAQSRIIDQLKTVKLIPRQVFARSLYDGGWDVKDLDVEMPGNRPWR
jgi:hypothetical protein